MFSEQERNAYFSQIAREGDLQMLKRVLERIKSEGNSRYIAKCINTLDEDGFSALHYAARYNHFSVVKTLIEAGADVNCQGCFFFGSS